MGAQIPKFLQEGKTSLYLKAQGLKRIYQGKVRDTYTLMNGNLLPVVSNRISIFDFVLPALIPDKGAILTALTHFWLTGLLKNIPNHLVQLESNQSLNAVLELKESLPQLPLERCLVIENLTGQIDDTEFIFRHHIGGSVYKKYLETGVAGGHELPRDLPKWSKLDDPIFTPSTKAHEGHDINVTAASYLEEAGEEGQTLVDMLASMYITAYAFAEMKGILILDTKFEASRTLKKVVDEVLTPDSSRFVDKEDWERAVAEKREPAFFDKQVVREWGALVETPFDVVGIKNLEPTNEEHIKFVHNLEVPNEVIEKASSRYHEILKRLTGMSLSEYQQKKMGIS